MSNLFDFFEKMKSVEPPAPSPISWIVAGLGNPGNDYRGTRHNVGFIAVDYLAEHYGFRLDRVKYHALCADMTLAGTRVLFMQPQTFMNLSGEAIRDAAAFYKIPPEHILIIHDDISLAPGRMRIRRQGSAGGHNGLKNIIYHLESDAFPRIKIGVGTPPGQGQLISWVTGGIPKEDQALLLECLEKIPQALEWILAGEMEHAMSYCN